ncbi:hypothetical protein VN12_00920 [Pirellula sp. SH-Sr6A]|nr:hypothetical protein VN12_00920 [Pirellula sp. SH-Sr6A]
MEHGAWSMERYPCPEPKPGSYFLHSCYSPLVPPSRPGRFAGRVRAGEAVETTALHLLSPLLRPLFFVATYYLLLTTRYSLLATRYFFLRVVCIEVGMGNGAGDGDSGEAIDFLRSFRRDAQNVPGCKIREEVRWNPSVIRRIE